VAPPALRLVLENSGCPARCRTSMNSRSNPSYMIVSKRKLIALCHDKVVTGWTTRACHHLRCAAGASPPPHPPVRYNIGVTKYKQRHRHRRLEHAIRRGLERAPPLRRLAVLRPFEKSSSPNCRPPLRAARRTNNPGDKNRRHAQGAFSASFSSSRDDFAEVPPPKFFRLKPGARSGSNTPTSSSATRW